MKILLKYYIIRIHIKFHKRNRRELDKLKDRVFIKWARRFVNLLWLPRWLILSHFVQNNFSIRQNITLSLFIFSIILATIILETTFFLNNYHLSLFLYRDYINLSDSLYDYTKIFQHSSNFSLCFLLQTKMNKNDLNKRHCQPTKWQAWKQKIISFGNL